MHLVDIFRFPLDMKSMLCLVLTIVVALGSATASFDDGGYTGGKPIIRGHIYSVNSNLDFPYVASLIYHGKHRCAATIIKPQYVLTAYRCAVNVFVTDLRVRAGPIDMRNGTNQLIQERLVVAYRYGEDDVDGASVAVLKLSSPLGLSKYIKVLNIAETRADLNQKLIVIGFDVKGCTVRSDNLLVGKVGIVENQICEKWIGSLSDVQLCTTGVSTNAEIRGNAGGPLIVRARGKSENDLLVGIVAYSYLEREREFSPTKTTIYADTIKLHSWISRTIETL